MLHITYSLCNQTVDGRESRKGGLTALIKVIIKEVLGDIKHFCHRYTNAVGGNGCLIILFNCQ